MQFLQTLDGLLEHIKIVENETIALTKEGHSQCMKFIEKRALNVDDEMLEVLQYQDIISQQLSATIEAMEKIQMQLHHFIKVFNDNEPVMADHFNEIGDNLASVLKRAQEKHSAFGGKTQHQDDVGVEFF